MKLKSPLRKGPNDQRIPEIEERIFGKEIRISLYDGQLCLLQSSFDSLQESLWRKVPLQSQRPWVLSPSLHTLSSLPLLRIGRKIFWAKKGKRQIRREDFEKGLLWLHSWPHIIVIDGAVLNLLQ